MSEENMTKPKHIRTVSVTSSKAESRVHSISMSNVTFWVLILAGCVMFGALLGVLFFESKQVIDITNEARLQQSEAAKLQQESEEKYNELLTQYEELSLEKAGLEEQIQVLSDTINQRGAEDEAAAVAEAELRIPSGFPVTGSVTVAEPPEEDNALEMAVYYEAAEDAVVVATAKGQVLSVRQNAYNYYEVQIDHGNGYVSVYTNAGFPLLAEEAEVIKGTPLFHIGEDNNLTKYQITKDGALIDVYDVMNIAG